MAEPLLSDNQLQILRAAPRTLVAYSGGLDSSLLLHLLCELLPGKVAALHFNHALSPHANRWQQHCEESCRALGVPISVGAADQCLAGAGLEERARAARYAFFEANLQPGDCLALAHHADDQAETLLLRMLRGSGLTGLCAIPGMRRVGEGLLVRPLLARDRNWIEQQARARGIDWIEDESNQQVVQDRNWLRKRVLPILEERWENVPARFGQVIENLQQAQSLQQEYAQVLCQRVDLQPSAFGYNFLAPAWQKLSEPAARAILEHIARQLGEYGLPRFAVASLKQQVAGSRADSQPRLQLGAIEARRHRDRIYLLDSVPKRWEPQRWNGADTLSLGSGIHLTGNWVAGDYLVRPRREGDRFRSAKKASNRSIKQLMQEADVPPWIRDLVPLVERDGELIAIAGMQAKDGTPPPGLVCRYQGRAETPLF